MRRILLRSSLVVLTTMSSVTGVAQAGIGPRAFSTSTRQRRQAAVGFRRES